MQYKDGVILAMKIVKGGNVINAYPSDEIIIALNTADEESQEISGQEIVVTSFVGEKHSEGSLHYPNDEGKVNAFDIRTWIYSKEDCDTLISNLKSKLGNNYDVVDERYGKNGKLLKSQHIHIEFDPKS